MRTTIMITTLRRSLTVLWFGSLAIVVLLSLATNVGPKVGLEVYAVRGGSMAPTIPVGAAIVALRTDPEMIRVGDVVTVRADNGVVFTHRVVEVDDSEADTWLRTKGDANQSADGAPVPLDAVIGVVPGSIPVVGYLIAMLTTLAGTLSVVAYLIALLFAISFLEEESVDAPDPVRRFTGTQDAVQA